MKRFIKGFLGFTIFYSLLAAVIALFNTMAMEWKLLLCIGCPLIAVSGFVLLAMMSAVPPDLAPDFLIQRFKKYYNRNGFCLNLEPVAVDGVAHFDIYFQNQYAAPCVAKIAIRPCKTNIFSRPAFASLAFEIPCPPAGFGYARVAVAIPEEFQGKSQNFEMGATNKYPEGKGEQVRFREGTHLKASAKFETFGLVLALLEIGDNSVQKIEMMLPTGVKGSLPEDKPAEIVVLWKQGDEMPEIEEEESKQDEVK